MHSERFMAVVHTVGVGKASHEYGYRYVLTKLLRDASNGIVQIPLSG